MGWSGFRSYAWTERYGRDGKWQYGVNMLMEIETARSGAAVLGYGAGLSVILSAFTFTGGRLQGYHRDPDVDEVSRKEYLRKNRRRPIEQTINELGEGRGAYTPITDARCFGTWRNFAPGS